MNGLMEPSRTKLLRKRLPRKRQRQLARPRTRVFWPRRKLHRRRSLNLRPKRARARQRLRHQSLLAPVQSPLVEDSRRSMDPKEAVEEDLAQSFAATGIDDALDLLEVVNAKTDKASVGQQAAGIERHPERRFKAALEAYQERELPRLKDEHPGLRLQQYKDLLYKEFQKSPDNPFNQTLASYDATKEERASALVKRKKELEDRLRQ
ncbi:DUF1014-domain-containing protein [Ceratobasidium sp. AG-I]|nr:DUF1014-domain-containing protein [Ceratobasidium sp. AG-I]